MLRVRSVSKAKGRVMILKNVNLEVEEGEVVGLFGPNGSGKSTLLKTIAGFEKPSCGKIFFGDLDITSMPPEKIAKLGIVYTFQIPRGFKDMNVLENIAIALMNTHSVKDAFKIAEKLLKEWGLDHIMWRKAELLSHGEIRLVEILKAYSLSPKVLLLDEPFAGLDVYNVAKVRERIEALKDEGLSMLITSHRRKILVGLADRFIRMEGGRIAES